MIRLTEPLSFNGRQYLSVDPTFLLLCVNHGRHVVLEALHELNYTPHDYCASALCTLCEEMSQIDF